MRAWRSRDGGSTWTRVLQQVGRLLSLHLHDTNDKLVFLLAEDVILVSFNRGETFERREIPVPPNRIGLQVLDFHLDQDKADWVLFLGQAEDECFTRLYRSKDHGYNWEEIDTWIEKAQYVSLKSTSQKNAQEGLFAMAWKKPMPTGVCQDEVQSSVAHPLQLVYYDLKGKDRSRDVYFDHVTQFSVVGKYLVTAVEQEHDLTMHISLDGKSFTRAIFPPNIRVDKNGFTILQSTTGNLVIDISKSGSGVQGREVGRLFKANSDGIYFSMLLDNTNRNSLQLVDWEAIGGIEGVALANQVINTKGLARDGSKRMRTMITFNDGGTWTPLNAPKANRCTSLDPENCRLHLHSVTDFQGSGLVFSASSAVGIVMGVGNVGPFLLPRPLCQTYLSRDAGRTWTKVSETPDLFEFGDEGGVLVLVNPSLPTTEASFSFDFGSTWQQTQFSETPVLVSTLSADPTSHTSQIVITGRRLAGNNNDEEEDQQRFVIATLDFSDRPQCVLDKYNKERSDFEKWSPLMAYSDRCILGREIWYWRRKPYRLCRVNDEDGVPEQEQVNCKCTERDYECDIGFFRESTTGGCQRFSHDPEKPKVCNGTYLARSGLRKIEASVCKGGVVLENTQVERQCGLLKDVQSHGSMFAGQIKPDSLFYFPGSDTIMVVSESGVFMSETDGTYWSMVEIEGHALTAQLHPYDKYRAMITTTETKQYLTQDRGQNWDALDLPLRPGITLNLDIWSFHPTEPNWIIFMGESGCSYLSTKACHSSAYYSLDSGKSWSFLTGWAKSCRWSQTPEFSLVHKQGIYCEQYADQTTSQRQQSNMRVPTRLVFTDDFMRSSTVQLESIVGHAVHSEFLVAAVINRLEPTLSMTSSLDGVNFNSVSYPSNIQVDHPSYSVLDSAVGSLVMSITTVDRPGSSFGSLFMSDSSGQFFSLTNRHVNIKDNDGNPTEFERMPEIDGVALLNEVMNPNQVSLGHKKLLRTKITMDNGRTWRPILAPTTEPGECFLNLQSQGGSFGMDVAGRVPGMMIRIGNVGPYLKDTLDCHTFMTLDGGHSWRQIIRGPYKHALGDQGNIMVLIRSDERPTNQILYSLDHGQSFVPFQFLSSSSSLPQLGDVESVFVKRLITRPGGVGTSFLILANPALSTTRSSLVGSAYSLQHWIFRIDFSGLDFPTCILDLKDEENDDFERWSLARLEQTHQRKYLQHGIGEDLEEDTPEKGCLFGRKVQYLRRISDRQCFFGNDFDPRPHHELDQPCACTRADIECDFDYELVSLASPDVPSQNKTLPGTTTPSTLFQCIPIPQDNHRHAPEAVSVPQECLQGLQFYHESIGYRKMAISSCVGDHPLLGLKKSCSPFVTPFPLRRHLGLGSCIAIFVAMMVLSLSTVVVVRAIIQKASQSGPSSPAPIQLHRAESRTPLLESTAAFSTELLPQSIKDGLEVVIDRLQGAWDVVARVALPVRDRRRLNDNLYQSLEEEQVGPEDATMVDDGTD
ncbi:vacuolar protein sorting/targeting protein PEP1 [Gryganskiella cystojenkinii]|nr:vacuolar protein sorting/targeting protein PEP1 [Gryganskiella cystojenkinii]